MLTRRTFLSSFLLGPLATRFPLDGTPQSLCSTISALEARSRGRLGFATFDLATGQHSGKRVDERFPMCSTFKFLVTSFVLKRVEEKHEQLDRRVMYSRTDLLTYSPVTQQHVNDGLTVSQLCEAAMILSDNTAANLLLASLGGPGALNAFLRSIGDNTTRLDRTEPTLNEAALGDPRDTTTPAAMLENLRRILFGDVLTFDSRTLLSDWLIANKTGDSRLRAGLPRNWRIGDRTGTGDRTTNDIAVIWPQRRAPVLVTVYLTQSPLDDNARNAIIADVGRALTNAIQTNSFS
jgi:beta-lactamase class A